MFELINNSRFDACLQCQLDKSGAETPFIAVKGTFVIEEDTVPRISESPEELKFADEYYGKPGDSSVKFESDLAVFKPSTDIVMIGHAYAPNGKPTQYVDVSLSVGTVSKTVRVFGDRAWNPGFLGPATTDPIPFVKMPLTYERAFGGIDTSHRNPKRHAWDKRNPVGRGYCVNGSKRALRHKLLPNIEDPRNLIRRWDDKPTTQGFGFISRSWEPRLSAAGTYDNKWLEERFPILPEDFDYSYFQAAHPDLVAPKYLHGDEHVRIVNATPEALMEFDLPAVTIGVGVSYKRSSGRYMANLDTIIIRPDEKIVNLVWRRKIPVRRKVFEINRVVVFPLSLRTAMQMKPYLMD